MSAALKTKVVEKVWGRTDIPQHFGQSPTDQIGEVWFEPPHNADGVLIKYLFTSEKLSVQVHPSDDQARSMSLGDRGKDECWLVLDAKPGAAVALGLNDHYSVQAVRDAAIDGSIEEMLVWHEARAGDFFYVPAGTIHAIGPGLVLLEVQQNTDTTFRLFDYGRPRELHLDQALECARLEPYSETKLKAYAGPGSMHLLQTDAFSVRLLSDQNLFSADEPALIIPLEGRIEVGSDILEIGSCFAMEPGDVLRSLANSRFVLVTEGKRGQRSYRADQEVADLQV